MLRASGSQDCEKGGEVNERKEQVPRHSGRIHCSSPLTSARLTLRSIGLNSPRPFRSPNTHSGPAVPQTADHAAPATRLGQPRLKPAGLEGGLQSATPMNYLLQDR